MLHYCKTLAIPNIIGHANKVIIIILSFRTGWSFRRRSKDICKGNTRVSIGEGKEIEPMRTRTTSSPGGGGKDPGTEV